MTETTLPKSVQENPALGRWIALDTPGRVTLRTGKVELGQGILTALAQIAADEMEVGLDRIDVAPADTALSPNEGYTAGSQSVEVSGASIRLAAAQARSALLAAAARKLGAQAGGLSCRDGAILHDGASTGLDLWAVAADVDWNQQIAPDTQVLRTAARCLVGTSVPRLDMAAKLGAGGFIHDIVLPDMLHVRVVRQPFRLARLAELDEKRLRRRHPAVSVVREGDFLALVAPDEFVAHRAHAEAEDFVRWEEAPGRWRPATTPAPRVERTGGEAPAPPLRPNRFAADYNRGMIAHAAIGTSCAVARLDGAELTVWSHSQGIFQLRDAIASCLAMDPARVRLIHAHGSGCYGHNGADDAALDAAIVAARRPGRAVRVQWSREDELSRGPLGASMSARVEATLDPDGRVKAWAMSVTSAPHAQRPGAGGHVNLSSAEALDPSRLPGRVEDLPAAAGGGASRNAVAIYAFPTQEVRVEIDTRSAIRTSSLRSLGAHLNIYAIESAMDELAALAEVDPLAFRLDHLTDARARRVLADAAAMSGWSAGTGAGAGDGAGMGLAMARYKGRGAYLAAVAKVEVDAEVRLERLWLAVDAGSLVNPEGARSQIEGGAIQSASWTLKEEVRATGDRVPSLGWSDYPILRFSEAPEIETRFVIDPEALPLGTGEAAQGPVAAAIGNAVSRALGVRMRTLPLTRERLLEALA